MEYLAKDKNFLAVDEEYSSYDNSEIVIVQAPLEETVSYGGGTAKGPAAILDASHYVEFYDEEMDGEVIFKHGICSLPALDFDGLEIKESIDKIYRAVKEQVNNGKFVVTLGGEHSLSSAPFRAHFEKYENLSVLQIDAHSDLRDEYEGSKYSHASVMARVAESTKAITQVGIRAQCLEESLFIKENKINAFYARDIRRGKFGQKFYEKVAETLSENVYLTFDVDGLDPSVISATGTPEPGGLLWDETLDMMRYIAERKNIVGFDVVELAPVESNTISDFNTAKLIYKMLNYIFNKR